MFVTDKLVLKSSLKVNLSMSRLANLSSACTGTSGIAIQQVYIPDLLLIGMETAMARPTTTLPSFEACSQRIVMELHNFNPSFWDIIRAAPHITMLLPISMQQSCPITPSLAEPLPTLASSSGTKI
jgi:hypothetical protein